jgi:hypothetical protein
MAASQAKFLRSQAHMNITEMLLKRAALVAFKSLNRRSRSRSAKLLQLQRAGSTGITPARVPPPRHKPARLSHLKCHCDASCRLHAVGRRSRVGPASHLHRARVLLLVGSGPRNTILNAPRVRNNCGTLVLFLFSHAMNHKSKPKHRQN